jgi:hypothetical protein
MTRSMQQFLTDETNDKWFCAINPKISWKISYEKFL